MAEQLVSMKKVKLYCKIPNKNTRRNEEISSLIDDVTADIQAGLGRDLFTATHTDTFSPEPYQTSVKLRQYPVQSVAGVCDNDSLLTEGTNYEINMNTGRITMIAGYYFTQGIEKVVVTYSAGYDEDDIPLGIQSAAKQLVYDLFYDRNAGSVLRLGSVRRAWLEDGFPPNVAMRLRRFQNTPVT